MELLTSLAQNHLVDKIIPNGDLGGDISAHDTNQDTNEVPDEDAIKMFVGQVPRSMDEDALKEFFEEFGRVYQLNVLRDKNSGVSRGCCFVTFFKRKHALDAQNALHNVKTMPGMHHAIQMKPADTENRNERKIFVGMVSKKLGEEEVKALFAQFGSIEDCTVLRDDNGISRGCAFVTFTNRQIAIVAIKAMHHSMTMEGCSSPLVVKFADTQKDKEQKKIQQMQTSLWSLTSVNPSGGYVPTLVQPSLTNVANVPSSGTSYAGGMLGSPLTMGAGVSNSGGQQVQVPGVAGHNLLSLQSLLQQQQQQQQQFMTMGLQQQYIPQQDTLNGTLITGSQDLNNADLSQLTLMSLLQQQQSNTLSGSLQSGGLGLQSLQSYVPAAAGTSMTSMTSMSGVPGVSGGSVTMPSVTNIIPSIGADNSLVYNSLAAAGNLNGLAAAATHPAVNNNSLAYLTTTGGKIKTPDGSSIKTGGPGVEGANNLFIYHLPQEFSDADLVTTFQPFGTIVSAKVFIDKQTNLSKCFGFVSYTTSESAQAAIQAMNGFQVGTKRLKVQLKKPKDVTKPY